MKKAIALLLACVCLFSLCSNFAFAEENIEEGKYDFVKDYTLEELQELQKIVEDEIKNKTPKDEAKSGWGIGTYVDEFNQPTGNYITEDGVFIGTFSNSAVTNKQLKGFFLVDEKEISVKLYEYGTKEVNNPFSRDALYNITVLDQEGEKHNFYGGMYSKGNRIIFLNDNYEYEKDDLIDMFNKEGELSFYIKEDDGMSSYSFTVDFTGFSETYKEAFEK